MIDNYIVNTLSMAGKYPTIYRVGIFGSFARGDASADSDMDLVYDYDAADAESTDELLNYIDDIHERLLRHTKAAGIDYVWYAGIAKSSDTAFRDAFLNDVIWVYRSPLTPRTDFGTACNTPL